MSDSKAVERAKLVLADVESLIEHHPSQADPKPGRPAGAGYGHLLRSGVALCYTAWEVYVEEALVETIELLTETVSPSELPETFREWVVTAKPSPWAFVGGNWRDEAVALVRARIEGDGKGRFGFNTASVGNVEGLYQQVLGISPIYAVKWRVGPMRWSVATCRILSRFAARSSTKALRPARSTSRACDRGQTSSPDYARSSTSNWLNLEEG